MKVRNEVIALSFRCGASTKEGSNKDRSYYSIAAMSLDGDLYDFFVWDDGGKDTDVLKDLAYPCLMDCQISFGSKNGKPSSDLLKIYKYSPGFDLGSVVKGAKLPMQDFVSVSSASKKINL